MNGRSKIFGKKGRSPCSFESKLIIFSSGEPSFIGNLLLPGRARAQMTQQIVRSKDALRNSLTAASFLIASLN